MRKLFCVKLFLGLLFLTGKASATVVHFEGFEDPSWKQGQAGNWKSFFSSTKRVASGTDGITSSSGNAHAKLKSSFKGAGPVTDFGGWSNNFGNGFATSLDIFLNPTWNAKRSFTYRVGVNNQSGGQLRFFDWVLKASGSNLSVKTAHTGDSGATGSTPNFTVSKAGWYTFENIFKSKGGSLLVDFNLYNKNGLVYSTSRGESSDNIATMVGGNRNGWLFNKTKNGVTGLAIDNTQLRQFVAVPEPSSIALLGFGLLALYRRRK